MGMKWLRQHPLVLSLPWKPTVRRAERSNAIDVLCSGVLGDEVSLDQWQQCFSEPVNPLTPEDRKSWLAQQTGVVMSSDAFLPFRDNIDCAKQVLSLNITPKLKPSFGVMFVAHPGGSVRDDEIIEACDEYGITLIHTAEKGARIQVLLEDGHGDGGNCAILATAIKGEQLAMRRGKLSRFIASVETLAVARIYSMVKDNSVNSSSVSRNVEDFFLTQPYNPHASRSRWTGGMYTNNKWWTH
ncbi:hypothetical protein ANCCEY_14226 [Ancylostoma ceylanicum]|uniref:Uncharacterized protein n=1 Tax=Ancylostoma ceylanicum TaxID=53326 RepID=A0A0D6L702_9BILA|nr:hypothetical protein ANCCEY_14226 [Ancylostoma ceylanicum]